MPSGGTHVVAHLPGRRARLPLAVAALLAAASAGALVRPAQAAQTPPPPRDPALQRGLERLVGAVGGPPGVIAVLKRGDRVEVYRAGVADIETGRPPRPTDHMRLASVSKAYSGAVALRLVDRGRLSLDTTIGRRLPGLPVAWHEVTLRQLLNHTSGLPDYTASADFRRILGEDPHHVFDSRKLLDFAAGEPLAFPPGSRYQYSNSDNIAVALMAEAATGHRYEGLLKHLVYHPLGLRQTSLPQGFRLPEPYLHGYAVAPPAPPEDVTELFGSSGLWASGAVVATPKDLGRFIRGYAGGSLLSPHTRKEQLKFVPGGASEPAGPGVNSAGLAIFRYATRCGVLYGHTGNTAGYTQLAAATPDGRKSLTFSITTQTSKSIKPALLAQVREVQEDFACALLRR
ncbi:serine hydrolase domain-containing protein [Streptomyces sp. BPTC-684]|uniref:serine hydrolase domain-containing protein n=1 Tax=Streptomyces sp. BPTC-684 TaxID=3043734 RepID=UPI0024B1B399|nr:serine hydrolase domain-containing protein [Streptomyces sp. BPTC-684]WHM40442.1 serine hydrolase domain-containing protein [Streptomyces sp. BPTC-684]